VDLVRSECHTDVTRERHAFDFTEWKPGQEKPLKFLLENVFQLEPVVGFEPTTDGLQIRFWHFATMT